ESWTDRAICNSLETSTATVARVRETFVMQGMEAVFTYKQRSHPAIQRIFDGEAEAKPAKEIWENPKRAAQKDTEARWTIKYSKKKDNAPKGQVDIAIPSYGYKSHIMTDRAYVFIWSFTVTDASRHDGAQLPYLLRRDILATSDPSQRLDPHAGLLHRNLCRSLSSAG
ncbi:MAG: hypothetical protein AAF986_10220, partial [Pseudomonadota bacterium]